jgi:hypothetical protein
MSAPSPLSKISAESEDSINSAFDIFSTPHTHTSILRGDFVDVHPIRESKNGTLEFEVPGSSLQYLDLSHTRLELTVEVRKADGTALDAAAANVPIYPGDNFFHYLFSSVTMKLNGQDVEYDSNYAYRAFIENLCNHGEGAKKTHMQATSGWFEDSALCCNAAEAKVADLTARKTLIMGSTPLSFYGKLRLSLFNQDRLIPPGIGFSLQLRRSDPAFCVMSADAAPADGCRVDITSSALYVR